jgi:hypothetical protein
MTTTRPMSILFNIILSFQMATEAFGRFEAEVKSSLHLRMQEPGLAI